MEQELQELGEVSPQKPKNAATSPVKIALSAKSIKGGLISESFSFRIKYQKNWFQIAIHFRFDPKMIFFPRLTHLYQRGEHRNSGTVF